MSVSNGRSKTPVKKPVALAKTPHHVKRQLDQSTNHRWIPPLALRIAEAAESLGISETVFREFVLDELAVVRLGTRRLIPVSELERWLHRHAERDLDLGGRR